MEIFEGDNDVGRYIRTRMGKRFLVVNDFRNNYVGLFDPLTTGEAIMSNSEKEKRSNLEIIQIATGSVLVAGLGIGLILLPMMNKEEVTEIDVVEKHSEVIELVAEQLPLNNKVNIIHDDIYRFTSKKKYDTIYLDIYPSAPKSLFSLLASSMLKLNGTIKDFRVV